VREKYFYLILAIYTSIDFAAYGKKGGGEYTAFSSKVISLIKRATDGEAFAVEDVSVNHCCPYIFIP
jgi:hypothetical protein